MSDAADEDSSGPPPDQDHKAPLARVREGFDLATDQKYTLVVEPWEVLGCAALPGVTFRFGDSFLIPRAAEALEALSELVAAQGDQGKLVAFGHTDKVGASGGNQALSERRAKATVALITNDLDGFIAIDQEESWGLEVVQTCLLEVGYRPGPIDGKEGPKTKAAVEAFQGDQGLDVDGIAGPNTRRALYREYLAKLSLGLPAEAFLDPPALGCGETHPVVETESSCEDNRRVTFFMFKAARPPLVPDCHDPAGEWYGQLAAACECGAPPPLSTPLTVAANGPQDAPGPAVAEDLVLSIVHPGGGPPPAGSYGSPEVWLRAETEPPARGSFAWTCSAPGVTLQARADEVVLLLDDAASASEEPIAVVCQLVTQAGNSFRAEHTLHTGFSIRFQHADGELIASPPRGAGEDEDEASYLEYSGDPLDTVFDIHQDEGDGDCGPTCATFFRYGGAQARGTPSENGVGITGGTVQSLAERMRAETRAPEDHRAGTDLHQMVEVLREFAGSWERRRVEWEIETTTYDVSSEAQAKLSLGAWVAHVRRLLERSPRGVLTGVLCYEGGIPYRDAYRLAQAEGREVSASNHWVVCLAINDYEAVFYDPGFGIHGRSTFETLDFFAAHMEWAKSSLEPRSAIGSELIASAPAASEWQIEAKTGICELDAGALTWGERLSAQAAAEWYSNSGEADARARALAEGGTNALVIEVPAGNFGVVQVNSIDEANARQPEVDREDSQGGDVLRKFRGAVVSLRFCLRAGAEVQDRLLRYRGSHRA